MRADDRTTAAPPATGASGGGTFFAALNCFRCSADERRLSWS
ncbi:MAG TPA: hypothetical protein VFS00_27845 [Polyangiaceae bacterium]|nr:hypothetical protein [Polyangiaceae bacterium]